MGERRKVVVVGEGEVTITLEEEYVYAALGDLERAAKFLAEQTDDDNAQGFAADLNELRGRLREALSLAAKPY